MRTKSAPSRTGICILLKPEEHQRLTTICKDRGQSKADFLRAAIEVHELVPVVKTRPLVGACLDKHLARLEREKRDRRRKRKKG